MRDFEISSREFTTAERKRILPATMTQLQKICSLLNILTFRRSNMTEEQLEARVDEALAACKEDGYKNSICNPTPSALALCEAEDRLAQWRFKRDVDNEMKRVASVVDDELKRIEGLNREISPHEQCYGCKVNLSNTLALAKKIGREALTEDFHESACYASFCCGKRFCHICRHEYLSTLENKIIKCPICHGRTACGKLPTFKALLKLADQKIPWALYNVYMAYENGISGEKIDHQKAKSYLLEAASAGDPIALYTLGNSFDTGSHKARKYYLLAADKGYLPAYERLSSMHLHGYDGKDSFRHASIATFFDEQGTGSFHLGILHTLLSKKTFLKDVPLESLSLSFYWMGKTKLIPNQDAWIRKRLQSILVRLYKSWHPTSTPFCYPGYSFLPLAKRIMGDSPFDGDMARLNAEFKTHCFSCHKIDRKNLRMCAGCKVFHYCGKACQLKHWRAGHKRECSKHWLETFCPDLRK